METGRSSRRKDRQIMENVIARESLRHYVSLGRMSARIRPRFRAVDFHVAVRIVSSSSSSLLASSAAAAVPELHKQTTVSVFDYSCVIAHFQPAGGQSYIRWFQMLLLINCVVITQTRLAFCCWTAVITELARVSLSAVALSMAQIVSSSLSSCYFTASTSVHHKQSSVREWNLTYRWGSQTSCATTYAPSGGVTSDGDKQIRRFSTFVSPYLRNGAM